MNFSKLFNFKHTKPKRESRYKTPRFSLVPFNTAAKNLPNFAKISSHHCVALFASEGFSKLRQV